MEMGSVELLSREGEIAIAKRIEAGKTVMIDGLCESPMTIKAIADWRDDLLNGKMQLRDIVDLEMMYGDDAEAMVYDEDVASVDDLEKGIVRFIGNANQRIKEDYLRILRFFRFYSIFSKAPIDKKALQACRDNKEGLRQLSLERIRDELFKLFMTPKVIETLNIMRENEIMSYVLPDSQTMSELDFLINTIHTPDLPNAPLRRLFTLYNPDESLAQNLASRLKLSNKQKEDFLSWTRYNYELNDFFDEKKLRQIIYRHGNDFARDKLILTCAFKHQLPNNLREHLAHIADISLPEFSVKGRDVITAGIQDNRKIGEVLDELEELWIESDFKLADEELLAQAKSIIASAA